MCSALRSLAAEVGEASSKADGGGMEMMRIRKPERRHVDSVKQTVYAHLRFRFQVLSGRGLTKPHWS